MWKPSYNRAVNRESDQLVCVCRGEFAVLTLQTVSYSKHTPLVGFAFASALHEVSHIVVVGMVLNCERHKQQCIDLVEVYPTIRKLANFHKCKI